MRSLLFGLPAGVSATVLRGLLDDGREVVGVIVPAAAVPHLLPRPISALAYLASPGSPTLSLGEPADPLALAWPRGLPVLAVADFDQPETFCTLATFAPGVGAVP